MAYIRTYENKRIDGYLKTLKEKPWKDCPCRICKELGIEVLIFRGNNRNRRRGFHNAYVFYHLLQKVLDDPDFDVDAVDDDDDDDADLPSAAAFSDRFVEIADDVDDTEQLTLDDFF